MDRLWKSAVETIKIPNTKFYFEQFFIDDIKGYSLIEPSLEYLKLIESYSKDDINMQHMALFGVTRSKLMFTGEGYANLDIQEIIDTNKPLLLCYGNKKENNHCQEINPILRNENYQDWTFMEDISLDERIFCNFTIQYVSSLGVSTSSEVLLFFFPNAGYEYEIENIKKCNKYAITDTRNARNPAKGIFRNRSQNPNLVEIDVRDVAKVDPDAIVQEAFANQQNEKSTEEEENTKAPSHELLSLIRKSFLAQNKNRKSRTLGLLTLADPQIQGSRWNIYVSNFFANTIEDLMSQVQTDDILRYFSNSNRDENEFVFFLQDLIRRDSKICYNKLRQAFSLEGVCQVMTADNSSTDGEASHNTTPFGLTLKISDFELSKEEIKLIQTSLKDYGLYKSIVNGRFSTKTFTSLIAFFEERFDAYKFLQADVTEREFIEFWQSLMLSGEALTCWINKPIAQIANVKDFTHFRQQAGQNGRIIGQIPVGYNVTLIDPTSYLRTNQCASICEGENQTSIKQCIVNNEVWIEVQYQGINGFVSRKVLK